MAGALYPWLKGAHVAAAVIFVAGLLLEALVLGAAAAAGPDSAGEPLFRAMRRWDHRVTGPALILVWALGLTMALQGHWLRSAWLVAKLAIVVALSTLHGFQSGALRRLAGGVPVRPSRRRRLSAPAIIVAALAVVLLAVLKPA
jgi:uncharacterized membrane protein